MMAVREVLEWINSDISCAVENNDKKDDLDRYDAVIEKTIVLIGRKES